MTDHFSFIRHLSMITAVIIACTTATSLSARGFRVNMMPNGSAFSCSNCHLNPGGGGARTDFGEAVQSLVTPGGSQAFWSAALAALDSDGDGISNGEELGDPDGDGVANRTQNISNPGNSSSKPSASPPSIQSHPPSQTIVQGQSVTFQVQATGDSPLTYSWFKNGTPLQGQQSSSLTINNVEASDEGAYTVQVSNSGGAITSNQAQLSVIIAPQITLQPSSIRLIQGSSATLTTEASGTAPLAFQWFRNNSPLAGATGAVLTFDSLSSEQSGDYRLDVTNDAGTVSTITVTVEVLLPLAISSQPNSLVVNLGEGATFGVIASGSGPISYQWFKGDAAIQGATLAEFTISAAQVADAGDYSVEVSNDQGSLKSDKASLTVFETISITTHPTSKSVILGDSAVFNVTASGSGTITYQWFKGDEPIAGETHAELIIQPVETTDAGNYSVQVIQDLINVRSETAVLTVIEPPIILNEPELFTVPLGSPFEFSSQIRGSEPLSYQWRQNGTNLEDQTGSRISFEALSNENAGTYTLEVTNQAGSASSEVFSLVIVSPPTFIAITPPPILGVGQSLTLTGSSDGSPDKTYQWSKNGVNIPNATSEQLIIGSLTSSDSGAYRLTVTNQAGSLTSDPIELTVLTPPSILSNPAATTVGLGEPAMFSVTASGSGPLEYQWKHFASNIPGANQAELILTSVTEDHLGSYSVEVTNPVGSVTSQAVNLTLRRGPVITTQPTSVAITEGDNATFSVEAAGSGNVTYQWVFGIVLMPGETSQTLSIQQVSQSDAGEYSVLVTDSTGTIQSRTARLTVSALSSHPADLSPTDMFLSPEELANYQLAWKSGTPWESGPNPVSLADVTHAAALGVNGGTYRLNTAPNTVPTDRWEPTANNAVPFDEWVRDGNVSRVVIPPNRPGDTVKVLIQVSPFEGTQVWAFEESIPAFLEPVHMNAEAQWDSSQRKLKWGPYTNDAAFVLSYELSIPDSTLESTLWSGDISWAGLNQTLEATTTLSESAMGQGSPVAQFIREKDFVIVSIAVQEAGDYTVEHSEHLNNWSNLINTHLTNNRLIFFDREGPNQRQRFYRYFMTP